MSALANTPSGDKHARLLDKIVGDLETLGKKLVETQQRQVEIGDKGLITDESIELQKFCSKLEYLVQFRLKEKKSATLALSQASSASASAESSGSSSREYWNFLVDVFKSSKSFQDAIKYVKNINEIKTNLGKGRAFIRFCLQYHRLADAVQQLTMDEKVLSSWYLDKAVWFDEAFKSRVIQLLYDLNDADFELVSKNNFELDTTWPVLNIQTSKSANRRRTSSISSYMSSFSVHDGNNKEQQQADNMSVLLSTTPLEMDDDLMMSLTKEGSIRLENSAEFTEPKPSVYYDDPSYLQQQQQQQLEVNEKKVEELASQLASKEAQLGVLIGELKRQKDEHYLQIEQLSRAEGGDQSELVESLKAQIKELNERLDLGEKQKGELNESLKRQQAKCENLSSQVERLTKEAQSQRDAESEHLITIGTLQSDNEALRQEIASLNFELSAKAIQEENLLKEALVQSQSIADLRQMCADQESEINRLKYDLDNMREQQNLEVDEQLKELQKNKISLQLKEEEIFLIGEQLRKSSRQLEEEKNMNSLLTVELNEIKQFYKKVNEQNLALINQLEMDNNEIKKRLVKLVKEKAELWQKADTLEYENMLKANAMWIDDSNVSNCMQCNSGFSLMLRKHHCRVCLKIYCYYCCNNWVEYNNSKLRVCKKCFEARENLNRTKKQQLEYLHSTAPIGSGLASGQVINLDEDVKPASTSNEVAKTDYLHDIDDEDDDDDPDINFEVRPEKLSHKPADKQADPPVEEELAKSASETNLLKAASIYSNNKTSVSDSLAKLAASSSPNGSSSIYTTSPNQKDELGPATEPKDEAALNTSQRALFQLALDDDLPGHRTTVSEPKEAEEEQESKDDELVVSNLLTRKSRNRSKQSMTRINSSSSSSKAQLSASPATSLKSSPSEARSESLMASDTTDTFAIVSQEEIDRIYRQ